MKLNLGSGHVHQTTEGWIDLDINYKTGCTVAASAPDLPFKDETFDHILASHFIEHIATDKKIELFNECWRILKPGGTMKIYVPYAFHPAAHQDPTHVSYWVPESGMYFTEQMSYLKYGIKVWSSSHWFLEDNGWVVRADMTK